MRLQPLYRAALVDEARNHYREAFPFEVKAIDEEKRIVTFIGSTEDVDRSGDMIMQSGWKLGNYRKNPVVLWAHEYHELPIGKAARVQVTDKGLEFDVEFTPPETNPFGDAVYRYVVWAKKVASSVGFIPLDFGPREIAEGEMIPEWRRPKLFKKQELLELSIVPVPDNPNAIGQAKSAGVITEEEEIAILKAIGSDGDAGDEGADTALNPEVARKSVADGLGWPAAPTTFAALTLDARVLALAEKGFEEKEIVGMLHQWSEPERLVKGDVQAAIRVIRSVGKELSGLIEGAVEELKREQTLIDDRLDALACEMREAGIEIKDREEQHGEDVPKGDPTALALELRVQAEAMEIERRLNG